MKIEKIRIQNFYSFKDEEITLGDYSGLTLIKGINKDTGGSNGSGKSALVEAVYFALTGKTIRKSTEDSLVNNQAKKHCTVQIDIVHNNDYVVITRKKKPTKLEFFVGDENRTKESVAATQQAIDSYLNINHKVLLASMFFGQSNDLNFLECTPDDKRTIIRNFLNLDDLFTMRDRIRSVKSSFYQGMKVNDALILENQNTLKTFSDKLSSIKRLRQEVEGKYSEEALSLSLEEIVATERENDSKTWQLASISRKIEGLESKIERLEETISTSEKPTSCDSCGQPLDNAAHSRRVAQAIHERQLLRAEISSLGDTQRRFKGEAIKLPITSREFHNVLQYRELKKESETFKELTEDTQQKIQDAQKSKEENQLQYEVMRFWEKAFSEQGVIKYIINNVLEYFNERCNYYLSYLTNSKYSVEFDEELTEKIETSGRLLPYISMSGGEKRKVNLAILLALKDLLLLTDKSHIDLLFFDEVAENIDENGVHGLYQLLAEIKQNKTIFIITHNKHLKTLLDSSKRITIIKHKGISKVTK
jgi:DNA repair exonuclease SbcCD ATPase subunit